ncbi:C40 family peptidase [Nocardioidaceae bacterium]|nr:C40 family peptidase [Nocardioidaceae bacterium]
MPAAARFPLRTLRTLRTAVLLPLMVLALVLTTVAIAAPSADAAGSARLEKIRKAVRIVAAQKGDAYQWGAAGPNAFDCSGLTYYSYRKAGFRNVPRTSNQQASAYKRVSKRSMRRGDFVFFAKNGRVYHMGVFAGRKNGSAYIIHAPYGSQRVKRERIWTSSWFGGSLR